MAKLSLISAYTHFEACSHHEVLYFISALVVLSVQHCFQPSMTGGNFSGDG